MNRHCREKLKAKTSPYGSKFDNRAKVFYNLTLERVTIGCCEVGGGGGGSGMVGGVGVVCGDNVDRGVGGVVREKEGEDTGKIILGS
ncbi:hypothetical protein Tco_0561114 [Tanacetum coccineum]